MNKQHQTILASLALVTGGLWLVHAHGGATTDMPESSPSSSDPLVANVALSSPFPLTKAPPSSGAKEVVSNTIVESHLPSTGALSSVESPQSTEANGALSTDVDVMQAPTSTTLNHTKSPSTVTPVVTGNDWPSVNNIEVGLEAIKHGFGEENQPPIVNTDIQQQLQVIVDKWVLTQDIPAYYTLPIDSLFHDPDGDPLTTRAAISIPGMQVSSRSHLTIQGMPTTSVAQPHLIIEARDDHHGTGDDAWAKAHFILDPIERLPSDEHHPLIGETLYRLETSHLLAGVYYNYEVVYCEAWKLDKGMVYFAASANKTQCPTAVQLQEVGEYTIQKNNDIVITSTTSQLNAQQRWTLKKEYASLQHAGVTNLFTTVYSSNHIESYTLQKNKSAMETRLNIRTGEYAFQTTMFDYLYPQPDGSYVHGIAGNYIFDYGEPLPYTRFDSDLNLQSPTTNLTCDQLLPYWQSSELAGAGETGDIISTSVSPITNAPIDCGEAFNPDWQKTYVYLNLEYQPYDYFVPGEIYSYVIKPKPQYAHMVEELKLNLHYHHPLTAAQ